MRVMFITTGLHVGGAEMMLYKILSRLDRTRLKCEVVNLRQPGPVAELIEEIGVPVHSIGMSSPANAPAGLRQLRRVVQQGRPAVIQSWMYHANVVSALAMVPRGVSSPRLIWGVNYTLLDLSFEKRLTRLLIRLSPMVSRIPAAIVYDSEAGRRDHESIGYVRERGQVIPNGIDFDSWRVDGDARRQIRSEISVPEDSFLIGLIGRVHPVKDHGVFLDAAERLLERRPNAHFLLAGSGAEAGDPRMQALLKGRTFNGHLHMLGHRTDVARVMAAMDLLSCASRTESFPNVIIEALACGTVSVVSDVGDAPRLVADERFVVPRGDPVALAAAWDHLASMPKQERDALASHLRECATERYSISRVAGMFQELYERVGRHQHAHA